MIARYAISVATVPLALLTLAGCATPQDRGPAYHDGSKDTQPPTTEIADSQPTSVYANHEKTWCDERPVEVIGGEYDDGTPSYTEEVVMDEEGNYVLHGLTTHWWENGQTKLKLFYVCGVRHGPKRTWWQDGKPWSVGGFFNGKDDGTWIVWNLQGVKTREYHLVKGMWQGMYTTWYENGQKNMEIEFVDGRQQGMMTLWDENGNVLKTIEYVDGIEQPMPG